jgi:MFS family permease
MLPMLLPIGALLAGIALLLLGSGLLNTVIALRGSLEGFSDQTLGLIGSTYFLGFFLGTFIAPQLVRRMGHIRAFAFFGAAVAVCMLLHALLVNPWFWMLLRVITGVALVGFYAVIESWLNGQAPPERRSQVFAVYMAVNLAALAAAQQLLRLDSPASFTLFAVAAIFVCLSLLPVTATRLKQPELHHTPRLDLRKIWDAAPVAFVGALTSGLAMGAFWGMAPVYGGRIGLAENDIGLLMTLTIVGGALLQWPIGLFSDRGDRRRVLGLVAATAATTGLLMTVFGSLPSVLMAGFFLFGGMAFTVYPIVVAHLIDHLHHEDILAGNTGLLFLHGVGAAIGPAVAGVMMGWLGASALPLHFALAFGALAGYALFQSRRSADEIVETAAHFTPVLRTSPAALEMMTPDEHAPSDDAGADIVQSTGPAPAAESAVPR